MKNLGFGTMRLPLLNADDPTSIDFEQVCRMVDLFIEKGFVYFDTAYPYHQGTSESAVKKCLVDRYPREAYILADKMPMYMIKENSQYETIFNEQLGKCGVTYFDYYLLHNLGRDRYEVAKNNGGFEFAASLKERGLAKNVGFSFHDDAETLDIILTDHPEMDFVQLQINYLDWDSEVAQSRKCLEVAKKHNKPVIVMEPVKGGTLANLPEMAQKEFEAFYETEKPSPASLAVRYAASCDNVFMVLSGMSNMEQLKDNISYMQEFAPLSEKERELTSRITAILTEAIKIHCTSCKYCMEVCPKNINIPAYFGLYNLYSVTGKKTGMYYNRFIMNHGKPEDCIGCGKCEGNCPQHIEIRKWLKEVAVLYDGM